MEKRLGRKIVSVLAALLMAGILAVTPPALAADPPVPLGTAQDFAVLASSTITNTGPTTISGDISGAPRGNVGLYPGTAITGTASITLLGGAYHVADAVALNAQNDLTTAYTNAALRPTTLTIPTELGGNTYGPGVYDSASGTFGITGTLTLDAQGDPDNVFVFKMESTLITASYSNIRLINGARFCRIFWQVGSSATLGTYSTFVGHILAEISITANRGATVYGQLLARNGAVTLNTNTIINGFCGIPTLTTPYPGMTQVPNYPPLTPDVTPAPTPTVVPTGSPTNLPPTGDNTGGMTGPGILIMAAGVVLILSGILVYVVRHGKRKS